MALAYGLKALHRFAYLPSPLVVLRQTPQPLRHRLHHHSDSKSQYSLSLSLSLPTILSLSILPPTHSTPQQPLLHFSLFFLNFFQINNNNNNCFAWTVKSSTGENVKRRKRSEKKRKWEEKKLSTLFGFLEGWFGSGPRG